MIGLLFAIVGMALFSGCASETSDRNEIVIISYIHYVNSGTWIDHLENYPTKTYLVIKPTDEEMRVELYQVGDDAHR
ncbi:MAG: hypothetical protein VB049_07370 [Candidatus Pelethousia sp.]|nr:hypothetical protein [Candidatus Pelethousia sp.]